MNTSFHTTQPVPMYRGYPLPGMAPTVDEAEREFLVLMALAGTTGALMPDLERALEEASGRMRSRAHDCVL
jgi:hypothetical protein